MNSSPMAPRTSRPVWPLAACTALLATGGLFLLLPSSPPAESRASAATAHAPAPTCTHTPEQATPPGTDDPRVPPPALATVAASASRTATAPVPPRGDGPGADPAIQRLVESAWPRDLPEGDEQQLLAAGRGLLAADATGVGRAAFPALFPPNDRTAVVPAFTRFRIQAAIARADPAHPQRAVVHLVWAGADRGGTYTDGRQSDLTFTRSPLKNGAPAWMPLSLS
ncbi:MULTISPECIES: hypothetical protein [unclassified Streptomyces]|uniref:hypothetical protein n=1 Tax=unclassified Streptomyces TaxID=2593676 RepID=UPI003811236C